MSWERKWKEFQTADRLDEAVGDGRATPQKRTGAGAVGTKFDGMMSQQERLARNRNMQLQAITNVFGISAADALELLDQGETFESLAAKDPESSAKVEAYLGKQRAPAAAETPAEKEKKTEPAAAAPAVAAEEEPRTKTLTGKELGFSSNANKIYSSDGKGGFFRQDKEDGKKTKMNPKQTRSINTALKGKELSFDADSPAVEPVVAAAPTVTGTSYDPATGTGGLSVSPATLPTLSPEERKTARTSTPASRDARGDAAIAAGNAKLSRRERRGIKKREKRKEKGKSLFHKITGLDTRKEKKAKKQDLARKATMWDIYKSTNTDAAAKIENPPTTTTPTALTPPDDGFGRRKDKGEVRPIEHTVQENISFEKKWKNYQRIVESTSKGHLADNEFQQKMKSRRRRNDVYTKPSGHKNPSIGSPFSKRAKPKGRSNTYFENMNEAEQEVLDSFELQNELNPASFEGDVMIPEIRERLMEIAQDFLDGIDFKMDVEDITLTGSLANYNWSKYSDFDLHILVDYEAIDADQDLVKRFFQDIKAIWNIRHNIFLKGYEVEVYVQNTNESHMSSGVYSVQNDEWNLKPEREETARAPVDKQNIEKKADDIIFQIDRAEKLLAGGKLDDALDAIDRLKQKVRNLRKIGLSKEDGVYSVENLAFKTLRRSMELERLSTLKNKAYDRQMSITQ